MAVSNARIPHTIYQPLDRVHLLGHGLRQVQVPIKAFPCPQVVGHLDRLPVVGIEAAISQSITATIFGIPSPSMSTMIFAGRTSPCVKTTYNGNIS